MAKENIPLIHNYCDRWCEKCAFTSRCAIFEETTKKTSTEHDIKNKAFWDRLSQNFIKAKTMLEEAAEKHGISLQEVQNEIDELEKNKAKARFENEKHVIIQLTREYSLFARNWLKTQPGMLDMLEKLKEELSLGVESQETAKEHTVTIKESLSVIQWYLTFIEPKLMRSLMGKSDFIDPTNQNDSDGSAKIAIIAMDRSMQAWVKLFELLPDQEDQFLKPLSLLERIKKETLRVFPNALKFIRPGFDEPYETEVSK